MKKLMEKYEKPISMRLRSCPIAGKGAFDCPRTNGVQRRICSVCDTKVRRQPSITPQSPHKRRGRGKPISEQGRTIAAKKRAKFGKTVKKVHPFVRVKKLHVIILTDTEVG